MMSIVTTTVATQAEAEAIARVLVGEQLAACVQVTGPIESWYRWNGEVDHAVEWRCDAKTRSTMAERAVDRIVELHGYEVPEILVLPVAHGYSPYLNWVADSVPDQ